MDFQNKGDCNLQSGRWKSPKSVDVICGQPQTEKRAGFGIVSCSQAKIATFIGRSGPAQMLDN